MQTYLNLATKIVIFHGGPTVLLAKSSHFWEKMCSRFFHVFAESSWWVDFDTYLLWVYFSRVFEGYDGKYFAISTYVCNALCILWLSHGYKLIHTVISTKVSLDIKKLVVKTQPCCHLGPK